MEIYKTQSQIAAKHNWLLSLVVLVLITFGVLALTQGIALVIIPFLFNIPFEDILPLFAGELDYSNGRMAVLFLQGLGGGLAFFLAGWIFSYVVEKASLEWEQQFARVKFSYLLLLVPLLFGFMLFDAKVIEWNMNVEFPAFMSGFEEFARQMEDQAMQMTKFLTDFQSFGEFLAGVLVIGVLAGIGEEYFFRGVLQPKLHRYFGNAHVGVWLAAFVFSAIHFQFYGFFPRLLLGALFGYLYLYSGSLVYPIVGHVLNNTFTIVMVYLSKLGMVDFNIEDPEGVDWYTVVIGALVFVVCMRLFIQQNRNNSTHGEMAEGI
ncbi:CPBP family intramembrane metalloprotease domain-containing protein [Echinicola strongylocentroti]|uniref:CPBP family intramembrane metalloprotease domain-containing protein n=1 Tax=Echinicola strongylocentroti TaxID=1795355 RepID=A0A2Z4IKL3_9BACT|nr:CPBP family intramembrane glutamic endopeptidase [Echinicola strongylocentroti]AWW31078.1 CPBP family intramembrane metalloprotease domain-containing protein [Echinicola strongylocentroti]